MAVETGEKIQNFFSQYRLRKYSKGQILIMNGDEAQFVYHLEKGNVKQYDVTYRGDEIILNIFKPPAFFPMSLVINKGKNSYIYEADTDIEVRQAPAEDVLEFVKSNPDIIFDLLSRVYRGVDGLLGRLAYLMASSAKSRLIYELVIEAKRFGTMDNKGGCLLEISEKDLGSRAGLSRETVSREMAKLKKDELIQLSNQGMQIKNLAALEQKLGQEV